MELTALSIGSLGRKEGELEKNRKQKIRAEKQIILFEFSPWLVRIIILFMFLWCFPQHVNASPKI